MRTYDIAAWVVRRLSFAACCLFLFIVAGCGGARHGVRDGGQGGKGSLAALWGDELPVARTSPDVHASLTPTARTRLDYFYLEAAKQKMLGNFVAAYDLYSHCREICPGAPEVLYELGLYHMALREDSVALDLLMRASEQAPENTYYMETLAGCLLDRGQTAEALKRVEALARLQPRRTDILAQLVRLYTSEDRNEDAIKVLDRIEVLEGKMATVSYRKFALYRQMGDEKRAFEELESLCREYPHEMSYRLAIGNQLLAADRVEEAQQVFDFVRRTDPDNGFLRLSMLQLYRHTGQDSLYALSRDSMLFSPATDGQVRATLMREYVTDEMNADSTGRERVERTFAQLDELFPRELEMLQLRASYLATYDNANDSDFVDIMDRVIDLEPDNTQALFHLMQYYGQHRDYTRLENLCRRAVLTHPDELVCHYYLGVACYQQDRKAEALQAFREGIVHKTDESRPEMVADLYAIMGDLLHEMGAEKEAYAAYDSCLTYQDDNVGCLNNYAYFLSLHGEQLDRAEEMSYRTVRMEPDNKTYLDTYAWILFMKQRYAEAKHYIDRVCPPDSTDEALLADKGVAGVVLEHAGDIAAMNGNADQAVRFWTLAQKAGGSGLTATLPKKIRLRKYIKE